MTRNAIDMTQQQQQSAGQRRLMGAVVGKRKRTAQKSKHGHRFGQILLYNAPLENFAVYEYTQRARF